MVCAHCQVGCMGQLPTPGAGEHEHTATHSWRRSVVPTHKRSQAGQRGSRCRCCARRLRGKKVQGVWSRALTQRQSGGRAKEHGRWCGRTSGSSAAGGAECGAAHRRARLHGAPRQPRKKRARRSAKGAWRTCVRWIGALTHGHKNEHKHKHWHTTQTRTYLAANQLQAGDGSTSWRRCG